MKQFMKRVALLCLLFTAYIAIFRAEEVFAFSIPLPSASGKSVDANDKAEIDYSNSTDGYVMARWLLSESKTLMLTVVTPKGTQYKYTLKSDGSYETFPLTEGNGSYNICVFENTQGTKFAKLNDIKISVTLKDEFTPFLRPSQYINYTDKSAVVKKAAELVSGSGKSLDRITAVYHYVVENFTYDKELAQTVKGGYIPSVDSVLSKGKGICFDYASVTSAMLRSQGIPTKMVFGDAGKQYHAWISVYTTETGWIDDLISFDGKSWALMDPTFASTGGKSANGFIGDGKNYKVKLIY